MVEGTDGAWLLNGWKMFVEHFAVVESWLEGGMNDGQDKDGYSADEGFSVGWTEGGRWGGQKRGKSDAPISLCWVVIESWLERGCWMVGEMVVEQFYCG